MSLSGTTLQRLARESAQALPGVSTGYPFTEHLLVHKIAGHVVLIEDLVQDSYDLVVDRLTARERNGLRGASTDSEGGGDGRHE